MSNSSHISNRMGNNIPMFAFKNKQEEELARGYSPFRDHPARGYMRFGKPVMPPVETARIVTVERVKDGRTYVTEYRGQVPGGFACIYGKGVVCGVDPAGFANKRVRKAVKHA